MPKAHPYPEARRLCVKEVHRHPDAGHEAGCSHHRGLWNIAWLLAIRQHTLTST